MSKEPDFQGVERFSGQIYSTRRYRAVAHAEVAHARANPGRCMMGIWSGITFDATGGVNPSSGSFRIIAFTPDIGTLTALEYQWKHGCS